MGLCIYEDLLVEIEKKYSYNIYGDNFIIKFLNVYIIGYIYIYIVI